MALSVQLSLPRTPQRGVDTALTLPLRDAANVEQTISSGTLDVFLGSTKLVDTAAIGTFGPPASFTLLGTVTEPEELSEEYLEVWNTDLGIFQVSGYLVRRDYVSNTTERDLQRRVADILSQLPPGETTSERFRVLATEKIQRMMLALGRRPWLIFDNWALLDAEVALALHYWAADAAQRFCDSGPWLRMAKDFKAEFEKEWSKVTFRHDDAEEGTITNGDTQQPASSSGVMLSASRPRRLRRFGTRLWR